MLQISLAKRTLTCSKFTSTYAKSVSSTPWTGSLKADKSNRKYKAKLQLWSSVVAGLRAFLQLCLFWQFALPLLLKGTIRSWGSSLKNLSLSSPTCHKPDQLRKYVKRPCSGKKRKKTRSKENQDTRLLKNPNKNKPRQTMRIIQIDFKISR